jgi:hypothetical protein
LTDCANVAVVPMATNNATIMINFFILGFSDKVI